MTTAVNADSIVVGGGFFGANVALHLAAQGDTVMLLEREPDVLRRASFTNQARVHAGYHYPRSFLTASRSFRNAPRFRREFADCVVDTCCHYYAIERTRSNVTAAQFASFCDRIGAPLAPAPDALAKHFNPTLIERVFEVEEYVLDVAALRAILTGRLEDAGVEVRLNTEVVRIGRGADGDLLTDTLSQGSSGTLRSERVYNCTYSRLNALLAASSLPTIPLKHELTELVLVEPPDELREAAVTVMCGPFFSLTPFPARGLHVLSHVRYTPHRSWIEVHDQSRELEAALQSLPPSHAAAMLRDGARYLPALASCRVIDSLWEIKTLMPRNEVDDGRPILLRPDHGLTGLTCVLGAKLDNIYDLLSTLPPRRPEAISR